MKTIISGVMLPPVWLPTSSTGPSSGTLPMLRTSARYQRRREQPGERQVLADVVGVAVVEVGRQACAGRGARRAGDSPATLVTGAAAPRRRGPAAAGAGDAVSESQAVAQGAVARSGARRRCASPARRASPGQPSTAILGGARVRSGDARRGSARGAAPRRHVAARRRSGRGSAGWCAPAARPGARARTPSSTTWRARGRTSATWRAKPAGTRRSRRPRRTAPAARRPARRVHRPRSPCGRVEVDVARRREERDPRRARAVGAAELVGGDVGGRGVEPLRAGEQAPELLPDPRGSQRVRDRRELGAQQPHQRHQLAAAPEGERRRQQAERLDPLGCVERQLERDPAAHRVADQVRALDRHRVHVAEHGAGEVRGVVGGPRGLRRGAEAGQVDARGRCGPGVSAATVSKNEVLFEPRPCRQTHLLRPVAGDQGRDRRAAASRPRGPAAAAAGRREAGRGPRSRAPGRGRRGRRGGAARRRRAPRAAPREAPARSRHRCR